MQWFLTGAAAGEFLVATGGFFEKQTPLSRYIIAGSNSNLDLIVPVLHTGAAKLMRDAEISYREKWAREHVYSIKSAYGKAPFFEFYDYKILPVLEQNYRTLTELNIASIKVLLSALLPDFVLKFSNENHQHIGDFQIPPYPQVFDDRFGFRSGASALDLLFNFGPEAEEYLIKNSRKR